MMLLVVYTSYEYGRDPRSDVGDTRNGPRFTTTAGQRRAGRDSAAPRWGWRASPPGG